MSGMSILMDTALKAAGYSKEQLDAGIAEGRALITSYNARFDALETNIGEILTLQREILAQLRKGNDNVADVHGDDAGGG